MPIAVEPGAVPDSLQKDVTQALSNQPNVP